MLLISLSFFLFTLCTYCFLLWFVQDQALDCNTDQHLEGISYNIFVFSLNWSQPEISISSIPSLLFMYLVSSKLVPAYILDGGCAEVLFLMEIHYSKIDNAIPLIRGSGFHVNVTMAHYSILYLCTLSITHRRKKKAGFSQVFWNLLTIFVCCSSSPYYQCKFKFPEMMERLAGVWKQHSVLGPQHPQITEKYVSG